MKESITDALVLAIEAHGLSVQREGDTLLVDEGRLILNADVFENDKAARTTVVLELQARSPLLGERPIIECFVGIGDSPEDASGDAFNKMLLGTFHVLVEALTRHACDDGQVDIEHWEGETTSWRAFVAPLLTHHSSTSALAGTYSTLFVGLQDLFRRTAPPGPHWMRVFVGAFDGELQACEVLVDNEPWEAGLSLLQSQAWQCQDEYQSVRHFVLMMPTTPQDSGRSLSSLPTPGLKGLLARAMGVLKRA